MKMTTPLRTVALLVAVTLVVSAASAGMSGTGASTTTTTDHYDVSVSFVGLATADTNQTLRVTVNNSGGDSAVFNPVVEVPLPESVSVSNGGLAGAYVEYGNGTTDDITAQVDDSSFAAGSAVFLFGEEVPAEETRTYYVNLTLGEPGQTTLETDVRPLYNESNNVRVQPSVDVAGFGNVSVIVARPDGTVVNDAAITVDGSTVGSGTADTEVVEGNHTVSVSAGNSVTLPEFTRDIGVGENDTIRYIVPRSLDGPTVIATTQSAEVLDASTGNVTRAGNATARKRATIEFITDLSGGTAVVAVPAAENVRPIADQSVSTDTGSIERVSTAGETPVRVRVSAPQDATITVQYTGYRLGDNNRDDSVDSSDATSVAETVASTDTADQYADVNGDGEVTAVDAMLIAQLDTGVRNDEYIREE